MQQPNWVPATDLAWVMKSALSSASGIRDRGRGPEIAKLSKALSKVHSWTVDLGNR